MIDFSDEIDYPSKARPGIVFRLKRFNLVTRNQRDEEIMSQIEEHDDAIEGITELEAIAKDGKLDKAGKTELRALKRRQGYLWISVIIPHTVKSGFVSVSGLLHKDGNPITSVDEILRLPDDELIAELYGACDNAARMSPEKLGNWLRPGTSSTPATPEAANANTTAETASENSSTKSEIAIGISLVA